MEDIKRRELLTDFSKHVPRILHRQLITEQAQRYIQNPTEFNPYQHACALTPSIQRFHGSILFVDISGFTVLSQKLDVESLKNYINGYFSNIIEIVEKWGGDVIKFAGDALYVVWQTNTGRSGASGENDKAGGTSRPAKSMRSMSMMPTFINQEFRQNATEATKKAVNCGLEICEVCGNYPVYMEGKSNPGTDRGAGMFSSIVSSITSKIISRSLASDSQQPIAHLDVHCGVSVGLMAGLDVGYDDRWEYFLVGDPLSEVARAESFAEKGDVVISGSSHELFHPNEEYIYSSGSDLLGNNFPVMLDCGCTQIDASCFRLCRATVSLPCASDNRPRTSSRSRSSSESAQMLDDAKVYEDILGDMRNAVALITPSVKKEYMLKAAELVKKLQNDENLSADAVVKEIKDAEKFLPVFVHSRVRKHLAQWIENYLIDHLARHVHDVARGGYLMSCNAAFETFHDILNEYFVSTRRIRGKSGSISLNERVKLMPNCQSVSKVNMIVIHDETDTLADELDDVVDTRFSYKDGSRRGSTKQHLNARVEAEVRNVTVMFIKIDAFDMSLLIDASQCKDNTRKATQRYNGVFGFLERTENEQMADKLIVDKLQRCLEVLHKAIYSHGGQLRQFIVDDKGTVCIASFGLRGAVNDDNAANAMEAADAIVRGLQGIQLPSAIGITTGKVYCGLVGSYRRHEYAIMGPSVNLSARLMGKAAYGTILCDQETMDRDRSHDYRRVGEIQAKGYAYPVATYRPTFGDSISIPMSTTLRDNSEPVRSLAVVKSSANAQPVAKRFSALRFSVAMDSQHGSAMRSSMKASSIKSLALYTAQEKLQHMIASVFYFTDDVSNRSVAAEQPPRPGLVSGEALNSTQKLTGFRILRGRENELRELLLFLFGGGGGPSSASKPASAAVDDTRGFLFDHEAPSRMAVVSGVGGIGKTAFLSAFGQKLFSAAKQDVACNIMILSNRTSSLSGSTRLNPLRPILMEILRWSKKIIETTVAEVATRPAGHQNHPAHSRRVKATTKRVMVKQDTMAEYVQALDLIFAQLPSEMTQYKQVVMDIAGIKHGSPKGTASSAFLGEDSFPSGGDSPGPDPIKTNKPMTDANLADIKTVLLAIMNFFAAYTKKTILVMIEDAHAMDLATLEVLRHLWLNGVGVHFLISSLTLPTTQQTTMSTKQRTFKNNGGGAPFPHKSPRGGVFVEFRGHPLFLAVDLTPLSREAAVELASDIAVNASPETLSKLIASGGGNPLYLVQLATTLAAEGGQVVFSEQSHLQAVKDMRNISTMQRRVEEIICYRLDRLDALSQMVLKAATVAAARGQTFSPKLVAFMINSKSNVFVNAMHNTPVLSARDEGTFGHGGSPPRTMGGQGSPTRGPSSAQHALLATATTAAHVNSMQYRIMVVSHVLKALADAGIFIQATQDDTMTTALETGDYGSFLSATSPTSTGGAASPSASPSSPSSLATEDYEFLIPTEQSIIYSLIVDEQREYFHGKVAQFHYQDWLRQKTHTGSEAELRHLSRLVNDVAYHAEQASLWVLAMRGYGFASGLERLLSNPRRSMEHLMECYKIFKCYEQESGYLITPLPLSWMDDASFVLSCVLKLEDYSTFELPVGLEAELECVYAVFGTDEANINLAVKLHLFMADLYFLSFADVDMAQHLLGVALKLIVVARLCTVEAMMGDSGRVSMDSVRSSSLDATNGGGDDEILMVEGDNAAIVSRTLEDMDVCHFFATFSGVLQASSSLVTSPRLAPSVLQGLQPLFQLHPHGHIPYQGLLILDAARAKDILHMKMLYAQLQARGDEAEITTEEEMNKLIVHFGKNIGMQAHCVSLQTFVCTGETGSVVDDIFQRIDRHLLCHRGTLTVYSSLLAAIPPTMMLSRWEVLPRWLKWMDAAAELSHDILSPHKVLWKHLKTWMQAAYHFHQSSRTHGVLLPHEHVSLADMKESIEYFLSADDMQVVSMMHHHGHQQQQQQPHPSSSSPKSSTSMYLNYLLTKCPSTIASLLLRAGLHPLTLAWQLICFAMYVYQKDIVVEPRIRLDYEILFHAAVTRMISFLSTTSDLDHTLVSIGLTCHLLAPLRTPLGINSAVGRLLHEQVCFPQAATATGTSHSWLQSALEDRYRMFSLDTTPVLPQYHFLHNSIRAFFPAWVSSPSSTQTAAMGLDDAPMTLAMATVVGPVSNGCVNHTPSFLNHTAASHPLSLSMPPAEIALQQ
eukprot:gene3339-2467_t